MFKISFLLISCYDICLKCDKDTNNDVGDELGF